MTRRTPDALERRSATPDGAASGDLVLVLGGARSGKSRRAEALTMARPAPWIYVATAEAHDAEMAERIARHRADRPLGWRTVQAPLDLAAALDELQGAEPVLVDCLTLWLTNHLLIGSDLQAETDRLAAVLATRRRHVCVVSNEVGFGIVPENALARRFRDAAGLLNQRIAAEADHVVFVAAGLALTLK